MKTKYFSSESTFIEGVSTSIHSRILKKQREGKTFRLALSGGSTPVPIYRRLAEFTDINWTLVEIFIVDERYVPLNDENSNYKMIKNTLLDQVYPSPKCIFFDTSVDIKSALEKYEAGLNISDQQFFDLIILGMGTDGHTASLFPGDPLLREKKRWVGHSAKGDPVRDRLTLTYPALESSEEIFLLARGKEKAKLLNSIQEGKNKKLPVSRIIDLDQTHIFLEE